MGGAFQCPNSPAVGLFRGLNPHLAKGAKGTKLVLSPAGNTPALLTFSNGTRS